MIRIRDILRSVSGIDWICFIFLSVLSIVYFALIWTDVVGLRNGDFSARLVIAQNIKLNSRFFFHDIWQHLWPPFPHVFNRCVLMATSFTGLNTAHSIKFLLSISALMGIGTLWLSYQIGKYFASPFAGLLSMLAVASLPIFHVINMSILSQAIAMPLLLLGMLAFAHEVDHKKKFYLSGFIFLAASLCRSDTVMYSGMLSFLLLNRTQWLSFITFNLTSSAFFLAHQTALIYGARVHYFNLSKYYDWNLTTSQKRDYIGGQLAQMWQVESATVGWGILIGIVLLFLLSHIVIVKHASLMEKRSRYIFIAWSGVVAFNLILPFFSENARGNHARDYLFGMLALAIACGIALGFIPARFGASYVHLKRVSMAFLLAVLCLTSFRAVVRSTEMRVPSQAALDTREWLEAHLDPNDSVLFETRWEHYLDAYTHQFRTSGTHWTVGNAVYQIEVGTDSVVNRAGADSVRFYDLVVMSAVNFVETSKPRYIVTHPIDRIDTLRDRENYPVKHRLQPHYVLSKMEVISPERRRLYVPGQMSEEMIFEKVYISPECHIWEYQGNATGVGTPMGIR